MPSVHNSILPRGLRNRNPLNIKKSYNKWKGKLNPSTDRVFEQFETTEMGLRAGFLILRAYINNCRRDTVPKIIERFAPTTENKTHKYVQFVLDKTGFAPDLRLSFEDRAAMCRLVSAMVYYECGRPLDLMIIQRGYDLAMST